MTLAPGSGAPGRTPRRTRLSTRLYLVGVVQLLLVAVAAVVIGIIVSRLPGKNDVHAIAARLEEVADDGAKLKAALDTQMREERLQISIYDADGALVAANTKPPLHLPRWARHAAKDAASAQARPGGPPPPFGDPGPGAWFPPPFGPPPHPGDHGPPFGGPRPNDEHGPHFGGPPEAFASFRVHGGEGMLVVRFDRPKPSPLPPILTLVFGLGVFGVGAWVTARWIARPLERLAGTARSFGRGDLTVRAGLERTDELGEVGAAFDDMAERIQALLSAEKELLANVAHELRTPLARIRVALEIAGEGDAETARSSLGEIAVDLSELESIVDDILTTARLEAAAGRAARAGFALHREEVAPSSIAERAAERLRERHPERPLELSVAPSLGLIEADPVLLRRVIDNLLENAHKYTPDTSKVITLSVSETGASVRFQVKDNGLGIPEEDLPRIFTAFFRGERSRSRGTGGVGLGLTLAKRIVEAHGGTIAAESEAGAGTTVTVLVPRLTAPDSRNRS